MNGKKDEIKEKAKSFLDWFNPLSSLETKQDKKEWLKKETWDWAVSIAVALLIYFIILPGILNTSSPLVVVSSCSEEPYLNIGDVLVLQGTSIENIRAPLIQVENQLNYSYRESTGTLILNGRKINKNQSNDIVVYFTNPGRTRVIHRALAKLETPEGTYLLTQGDANSIPDQLTKGLINGERRLCINQNPGVCISTLINQEMVVGKKLGWRLPLLGHVKLFFCDVMPFCDGHANRGTGYEYRLTC